MPLSRARIDQALVNTSNPRPEARRWRFQTSSSQVPAKAVGSIGIQIGGYTALVPERRAVFAKLAFRAMLAGTLTTCLVAAVAGVVL